MNESHSASKRHANRWVQCFDVSFIMVLCFCTLLATMLVHGKVLVGSGSAQNLDHSFHASTFLLVAAIFAVYLWYMLRHSERELGEIVRHIYGKSVDATPSSRSSLRSGGGAASTKAAPGQTRVDLAEVEPEDTQ